MINEIVKGVLHAIIWLMMTINNLIFAPLIMPFKLLFEDSLNWENMSKASFYTFFNNYVFRGVHFCTRAFFNLTGFDEELLGVAIALILVLFAFAIGLHGLKAFTNIWTFFRKGKDS